MSSDIKATAIPAAGYVYQTMQGVNLLCDWLDSPTRYTRVRFECDEEAIAPQGLDDLVAERPDGRTDLWQVKFTPSPDKYFLDWKWLLEKTGKAGGKSRSNMRKWFDAFEAIAPARIGEVRLLTNRVPDLAMEACLAGSNFIDYTRAPAEVQAQVEAELGGAENCRQFFMALEVRHSDKGFSGIEAHVTGRLRRHGTAEGAYTLKYRAVHWAIERNEPTPDGWISLDVLRATLRVVAPEPLPENFVIPPGYRVPDSAFHLAFVASIESAPRQPIVLTGPPGRGKSTYLSKVCELLQKKGVPLIRHHYYLSPSDRTHDRYTSFVVEESLLAQIRNFHSEVHVTDRVLSAALSACAAHYKAIGKPFVVVLDGLDHVWRNQGRDKRPLDEIFNQVLPTHENLVVVVGTQPVDDAQLPDRLLALAPRSTWKELPAMSGDAIRQYLHKEVAQGRLRMEAGRAHAETELQAAAAELRARTNGHPLHVIYATEELVRSGRALSKWSVEQLAGDLSHDVKSYYGSLWQLLSASQKDVLRLVCEFPFYWSRSGLGEIAALAGLPTPVVTAVEHLMHASAAGLKPFHESLVVFVKQTDGYDRRVAELTPHVEAWLDTNAPNALRVNWLWAVRAKQGRPEDLISGLSRDWVMQRLQEGYPTELFEGLLGDAEEHAIRRAQYADAFRLRHLKYRLLNSLSYQLLGSDAARLKSCTWALAPDARVIDEAVASRHETATVDVAALGLALGARGDLLTATMCGEEAIRRFRGESRFTNENKGSEAQARLLYLARAFSWLGVIGTTPRRAAEIVSENSPAVGRKFLEPLVDKSDVRALVNIAVALPQDEPKLMACDAAVRAAALAEANLSAWSEFSQLSCGPLVGCLAAVEGMAANSWARPLEVDWLGGGYDERKQSLANLAHDWFFGAAHLGLTQSKHEFCLIKAPTFKDRENVSAYLDRLGEIGVEVAEKWKARQPVSFADLYEAFQSTRFLGYERGYEHGQGASDFRRSLHSIGIDVHLLSSRLGARPLVGADEMTRATSQTWFDPVEFRTQYVSGIVRALSDEAADIFVRDQLKSMDAHVDEETGVRMMACLELCEMALRHGLRALAADLCQRTWELVLGYGQRKDPALSDVMDAINYLVPIAPDEARRLLFNIAPQVHHVLAYTDGKGTRHVLAQADELLARLHRGALVVKHREHTEAGDWHQAEDSLRAFVSTGSGDSLLIGAVLRTGLHADAIEALRTAAAGGDAEAVLMLRQVDKHLGTDVGHIREPGRESTKTEWKPFPGDVTTYQVAELRRLLADLAGHFGIRGDVLRSWYSHWEANGKGSELIAELEPLLLSEECRNNDLNELLDVAFQTKLALEGVVKAFPYVVQAQLFNGGWLGPMHMEKLETTEARLRLVVAKYPKRCDEFFQKSAYSWYEKTKRSRIVPSDIMVFFLGLQGRTAEAVQFAEAMVQSVREDTRTLRLETPAWAKTLAKPHSDSKA